MKAVYASTVNHDDPLAALAVGEQPEPQARPFWSTVSVRAVTVNHHDVWSLQGVGLAAEQTPMILGTDAVGILDEDIPGKLGQMGGAAPGPEARNLDHFALAVRPFDEAAIRAHLAAHGVAIIDEGQRFGAEGNGTSLYLQDPEGNTVELKGPPD